MNRDTLLSYFDVRKPLAETVGIEYELLGVLPGSGRAMPFKGERSVSSVLSRMEATGRYAAIGEGGHVLGLQGKHHTLTLEPGCQTEFSSGVHHRIEDLRAEFHAWLEDLEEAGSASGIAWLPMGFQPYSELGEIEVIPKERYRIMTRYLPTRGGKALAMMRQTAGVQSAVGYRNLDDAAEKFRTAMAVSSFASAAFANSPFASGKPNGFRSFRMQAWADCDPDRCLFLEKAMSEGFTAGDYVDWLLDVPMMFLTREGHWVPVEGRCNFQRFLDEGFRQFRAEPEDWALHAGSVFPEVRLRRGYVEIRAMDSVSPALALAAAAFWRGLLEDGEASKEAFRLTATPSMRERMELHHAASRNGLRARWQGRSLREWMLALLKLARRGLARFEREKEFLAPLERLVEGGDCPAETALARWRPEWKSGPEDFVEAFRLRAGNFKD